MVYLKCERSETPRAAPSRSLSTRTRAKRHRDASAYSPCGLSSERRRASAVCRALCTPRPSRLRQWRRRFRTGRGDDLPQETSVVEGKKGTDGSICGKGLG